jgi:UDP-GlcNAc3NAcA epimerase
MEMPEEINRILTDRISSLLFCPTDVAVENLIKEGFENFPAQIIKNGDVMQDAALYYASKAENKSQILQKIGKEKFVLATVHRQENTDSCEKLKNIVNGLNQINVDACDCSLTPSQQFYASVNIIPELRYRSGLFLYYIREKS